ncbi:MAG: hypothetical protein M1338_00950 [Patescibacteria group bacterium]|nr:hypothetical protein [Patescibacteria group bacterium]
MTQRKKIIFITIAVIALLIIIFFLWWLLRPKPIVFVPPTNTDSVINPPKLPAAVSITNSPASVPIKEPKTEAALKTIALTFAERFGSFSNQSNFENLNNLRDLMTVKMRGWADNYIAEQRNNLSAETGYYGVTTQALSVIITSFDESLGRADAQVSTQRQESKGSTQNPRVYYQSLYLKMVKTDSGWKVDEAAWK